jgi:xanthine dehydrogenase YagT iron-sulfur-binding subunit
MDASTLSCGALLAAGAPAPDFELGGRDDQRIRLSDLRGEPVILAFYPDLWDPSRTDELAHFNWLVSQVPGNRAELLAISRDGMWCDLAFAESEVRVPVLADLAQDDAVALRYGVSGEQAMFVVDAEGKIAWSHRGAGTSPRTDELVGVLTALAARTDAAAASERDWHGEPVSTSAPCARDTDFCDSSVLLPTRREFVATALAAAFALTLNPIVVRAEPIVERLSPLAPPDAPVANVTLRVNGQPITLNIEPRVTLLDALREYAGLTGTKKGCDHGQCGACTVHVNGRRTLSCLTFAAMHQADEITTVEGLARGEALHPMQTAFIEHDGFQCGYCTSGQLMSATALLKEPCGKADADVRECMSGNLCRCGAYEGIVAAIQDVRRNA